MKGLLVKLRQLVLFSAATSSMWPLKFQTSSLSEKHCLLAKQQPVYNGAKLSNIIQLLVIVRTLIFIPC
jgi:hypothetical protein